MAITFEKFTDIVVMGATPRARDVNYRLLTPEVLNETLVNRVRKAFDEAERGARSQLDEHNQATLNSPYCNIGENYAAIGHIVRQVSTHRTETRENFEWLLVNWKGPALSENEQEKVLTLLSSHLEDLSNYVEGRHDWADTSLLVPLSLLTKWNKEAHGLFRQFNITRERSVTQLTEWEKEQSINLKGLLKTARSSSIDPVNPNRQNEFHSQLHVFLNLQKDRSERLPSAQGEALVAAGNKELEDAKKIFQLRVKKAHQKLERAAQSKKLRENCFKHLGRLFKLLGFVLALPFIALKWIVAHWPGRNNLEEGHLKEDDLKEARESPRTNSFTNLIGLVLFITIISIVGYVWIKYGLNSRDDMDNTKISNAQKTAPPSRDNKNKKIIENNHFEILEEDGWDEPENTLSQKIEDTNDLNFPSAKKDKYEDEFESSTDKQAEVKSRNQEQEIQHFDKKSRSAEVLNQRNSSLNKKKASDTSFLDSVKKTLSDWASFRKVRKDPLALEIVNHCKRYLKQPTDINIDALAKDLNSDKLSGARQDIESEILRNNLNIFRLAPNFADKLFTAGPNGQQEQISQNLGLACTLNYDAYRLALKLTHSLKELENKILHSGAFRNDIQLSDRLKRLDFSRTLSETNINKSQLVKQLSSLSPYLSNDNIQFFLTFYGNPSKEKNYLSDDLSVLGKLLKSFPQKEDPIFFKVSKKVKSDLRQLITELTKTRDQMVKFKSHVQGR